MMHRIFILSLFFICSLTGLKAQNIVFGTVTDKDGEPLEYINIVIPNSTTGTSTNAEGYYELNVGEAKTVRLEYSSILFSNQTIVLSFFNKKRLQQDITMTSESQNITGVVVKAEKERGSAGITRLKASQVERLPSTTGGVEALIKTLPGVSSSNELSSQYSVRGGNYDENLIYVNDFEIYRPFLVRSGQQEGLSFINSDLVSSIAFSAGGFESKYGDKMSSVLDIKYKKPKDFGGSVSASLMGINAHLEGTDKRKRLTYVAGIRQRRNAYLLNSLSQQGTYDPLFVDFQSFLSYQVNQKWQLQLISNYSKNRYEFQPESQIERLGSILSVKQIRTAFEGREKDTYDSFMAGLGGIYTSTDNKLSMKFLASLFTTSETETYDIIGEYFIGEVESDLGKEEFGQVTSEYGVGTYHDWARNKLQATIGNFAYKGFLEKGNHFISWGTKYQFEDIDDRLNEWQRVDSAGYSLSSDVTGNFSSGPNYEIVDLFKVLKSDFDLESHRVSGFLQDSWTFGDSSIVNLTYGARFNYWSVNEEFFVTPRVQLGFQPKRNMRVDSTKRDSTKLNFRLAAGSYYQPPFYREMRNYQGKVNTSLKSQKSIHVIGGMDYDFYWWGRPFKFTSEAYFKWMWDLVPYDLDNVLIRYYGENRAKGYSAGIDLRVNGEFVPGTESWFSLSLLQTKEKLEDDGYTLYYNADSIRTLPGRDSIAYTIDTTLGWIKRPTNQLLNFSIFFQDNLPGKENFKMNLNLLFGTPLPFGPPNDIQNRNRLSTPSYIRVDIGFSALLFEKGKKELRMNSLLNKFENIWFAVEVFNLLNIKNTSSYNWINDFTGLYYPVPNRLTNRRLNARMIVKF